MTAEVGLVGLASPGVVATVVRLQIRMRVVARMLSRARLPGSLQHHPALTPFCRPSLTHILLRDALHAFPYHHPALSVFCSPVLHYQHAREPYTGRPSPSCYLKLSITTTLPESLLQVTLSVTLPQFLLQVVSPP